MKYWALYSGLYQLPTEENATIMPSTIRHNWSQIYIYSKTILDHYHSWKEYQCILLLSYFFTKGVEAFPLERTD